MTSLYIEQISNLGPESEAVISDRIKTIAAGTTNVVHASQGVPEVVASMARTAIVDQPSVIRTVAGTPSSDVDELGKLARDSAKPASDTLRQLDHVE